MMIQVIYNSGTHDMIKAEHLNRLLLNGEIDQFKRTTGWVKVGHDPIRNIRQGHYSLGQDRRHRDA